MSNREDGIEFSEDIKIQIEITEKERGAFYCLRKQYVFLDNLSLKIKLT